KDGRRVQSAADRYTDGKRRPCPPAHGGRKAITKRLRVLVERSQLESSVAIEVPVLSPLHLVWRHAPHMRRRKRIDTCKAGHAQPVDRPDAQHQRVGESLDVDTRTNAGMREQRFDLGLTDTKFRLSL